GDRVFLPTDNGHLLCLNRLTGALMWEVVMPPDGIPDNAAYGATSPPLIVDDLVITGIAGGDGPGISGFVTAYKATTGEQVWRYNPIPRPGEPGSETWKGTGMVQGGGAPWLTGSYDPQLGLLYWAIGQPYPTSDDTQRLGDNLYTNCVV